MRLISCALILLTASALHAGISFSVSTDKSQVAAGEQFLITARVVSDKELSNIQPPAIPPSEYYTVVNRSQNQSSSIQIINGKMSKEVSTIFHFALTAKKEGSFTFPSLQFTHAGKSYRSKPFTITISKTQQKSRDLTVSVFCSKRSLYVGEQGVLTVRVAHKPGAPINLTDQGFGTIVKTVEETFRKNFAISRLFSNQIGRSQKQINGQVFQVFELGFSLIPLKSGAYTLPAIPFQYESLRRVRRRSVDPFFDDWFGGSIFGDGLQRIPQTAMSGRFTLTVKELPTPPAGFSGAVGSFALEADVSPRELPAGEAATLKIAIRGNTRPGNMGDVTIPELSDFEVFTPEKATSVDTTVNGFVTRKGYKYLLIPQTEGRREIPAITWTYFDPEAADFKTASAGPFPLSVSKGSGRTAQQSRYLTQEDIRQVGRDIRFIKTPARLKNQSPYPHRNTLFLVLYPLPFLLAVFSGLYRAQSRRRSRERDQFERQQALRRVFKEANSLKKTASGLNPEQLTGRIADITEGYITHRFGFAAAGKTLDELREELVNRGVAPEHAGKVADYLRNLDMYRFGGIRPDQQVVNELIATMQGILADLEQYAKKGKTR